jgi:hypothetical protein
MDLHLTPDPHDRGPVRLFVHGALVAEYSCGLTQTRDSLMAEVTQARALQALKRIIQAWAETMTPRPGPIAFLTIHAKAELLQGVEAGLLDTTVPHPYPGVPPIPPEHTTSYRQGYEHGQALRRCLEVIAAAEQEQTGATHG